MKILNIFKEIFWLLGIALGILSYGKYQGRKSEKTKSDTMLLDDIIAAKEADNDINNLTDAERSERVLFFSREERKRRREK